MRARSLVRLLALALAACELRGGAARDGGPGGDDGGAIGAGAVTAIAPPDDLLQATHVWARAADEIWVLDGSPVVHIYDGAGGWTRWLTSAPWLSCLDARGPDEAWFCAGRYLMGYDGSYAELTPVYALPDDGRLLAVWAPGPSAQWAIGDGRVLRYDRASVEWTDQLAEASGPHALWGAAEDDVYVIGGAELLHFDGRAWSTVEGIRPGSSSQVWGLGSDDVWVTGVLTERADGIAHRGAGGWAFDDDRVSAPLVAQDGTASDDVWGVGHGGTIARWDGEDWELVDETPSTGTTSRRLYGVDVAEDAVWIVGEDLDEGRRAAVLLRVTR
jgi:hypothetical protein